MEHAQAAIEHIFCPLHKELIRRIGIYDKDELSLFCIGCIESVRGDKSQERYILEDFLQLIVRIHAQAPKLKQLLDSTNQILKSENEIVADFCHHIEKQKEQVNAIFDTLRQSV